MAHKKMSWRKPRHYHFAFIDWVYRGLLLAVVVLALVAAFVLIPTKSHAGSAEIALINSKLARWVRPTGKCPNEQLSTLYGNGDGLIGKPISCGGVLKEFDLNGGTIASKSHRCGTRLTITNPRNGKTTTAVVRDYGPATIAKLDLGPTVARELNLKSSAFVCVQ